MKENGSKASDIRVYLGPSVSQRNYEVDKDVAMLFSNMNFIKSGNKFLLDLTPKSLQRYCSRSLLYDPYLTEQP